MNAVAALFGPADAAVSQTAVKAMLDRMPERAAGHRMVVAAPHAVVGAAGRSPAFASDPAIGVLAGDLRLDNAADLRRELDLAADVPEPAVALLAFARWGDEFAARLAGDFALVIADIRSRRLLAVRDPLGIRPLYYRAGTSHVRCASELRALLEAGDSPDEGFLAEVLTGDIADIEATPFLSVRRVPGGHLLIVAESGISVSRYWHPPHDVLSGSLDEHAERFLAAFDEAVRARCAGASTVGAHLSGGLDSSSILASICANGFATPVAGALRFPWPETDESSWIAAVAGRWSIVPLDVTPPIDPPPHDLASAGTHADVPDYPTGGPLFAGLHAAMAGAGAHVALTGFGGDQWWTGEMAHIADLLRGGRLGALRQWKRAGASIGEEVAWSWRAFARQGVLPLVPGVIKRAARGVKRAPLDPWIEPAFAVRVDLRDRLRRRPDTRGAPSESWRRMRWRLDSGEEAFFKERADRQAVASGIDLRHPFYDRRLVELAFSTPQEARIGQTINRAAMRAAMSSRLPPETLARTTKADFSPLLVHALGAPDVRAHLAVPQLAARGWVVPAEVARLATAADSGSGAAASSLWRILAVEAWLAARF